MSDYKSKTLKDGVKKGASIIGKIIKWVIIAIFLIIAAVCAYSCYTCTAVTKAVVDVTSDSSIVKDAVRSATGGEDRAKMASEAMPVTSIALYNAYEENTLRADNTYKEKFLRVTGIVKGIDQDLLTKKPYVKLVTTWKGSSGSEYEADYVYVYFKDSEHNMVADLDIGKNITIVGLCEGKGILSVNIKDAFFE
ncbi:MAG: OB-fold putative lipoprotein [Treponema sp.]|nr:OB-fold putative lipoprotein [Treponema sp.]MCL2271437.1 OB-fold putative lipoprotein [Treponema sp.]